MPRRSICLSVVVAALVLGGASRASANGAYSHVHITQLALAQLPPGELADLFADPEMVAAVEAGSMFPDSGYAASDPYGEIVHWEPFLHAYLEDLHARFAGDYSSREAKLRIAFMLGFAGHAFVDQVYDTTLLERAAEMGDREIPDLSYDQVADYFLTIDQGIRFTVDDPYAPYADLPAIIANGPDAHAVTEAVIRDGMSRMSSLTHVQSNPRLVQSWYLTAWEYGPFLGTHYYDARAVGSVPWMGGMLVDYWRVLAARAHETDVPSRDLLYRSVPADGATNWNVDLSDSHAWGRISLFFGYAVDRDALASAISLRGSDGVAVPTTLESAYGSVDCSLVHVVPSATLAYDTTYTLELAAGATTLFGEATDAPIAFSFRTRCAAERLSECPPLPDPLVVGPRPEHDAGVPRLDAGTPALDAGPHAATGGGGCSVSHGGVALGGVAHGTPASSVGFALGALVAFGGVRRRRARR